MHEEKRNVENPMPVVDDGWWESVLAEERQLTPHPASNVHRGQEAAAVRPHARSEAKAEDAPRPAPDWTRVQELYRGDQIVTLNVTGFNRGGLLVEDQSLYGFVPFSHLVEAPGQSEVRDRETFLQTYVGRSLNLKVIECVPDDGRIVFSERAALAEPGRRSEIFHALHVGDHPTGTVTNITDFGVFVDLGGVEGLIHISELSWGRVAHPSQILHLNQSVEVQVLDLSAERCRVALSLKRLFPNPWLRINRELTVGQLMPAVITSVLSFGAFARLGLGVEWLIHASEMPLAAGQAVKDLVHEGQALQVRILHVDAAHQRMGLSMCL
jgi:small subunit ribosomal protein S1